jgi:hypothetical protein
VCIRRRRIGTVSPTTPIQGPISLCSARVSRVASRERCAEEATEMRSGVQRRAGARNPSAPGLNLETRRIQLTLGAFGRLRVWLITALVCSQRPFQCVLCAMYVLSDAIVCVWRTAAADLAGLRRRLASSSWCASVLLVLTFAMLHVSHLRFSPSSFSN